MQLLPIAAVVGSLVLSVQGAIVPNHGLAVHERRHAPHREWIKRDRISPRAKLPVRIGLKQRNLEKGYNFLMEVSHPSSPNYGQHWTPEKVTEVFAPSEESVGAVMEWLVDSGIDPARIAHSDNKAWLAFDAFAEEVEKLLNTEYHEYEHIEDDKIAAACDEYRLPSHIQEHVDYVTPGIKLIITSKVAGLKKRSSIPGKSKGVTPLGAPVGDWPAPPDPGSLATCDVLITPACIKALYQIPPAPIFPNPTNAMGIYEEGDYYDQEDLDLFFQKYTQYIPQGTHPTPNFIDGAEAPVPVADGGGESTLDMELTYPIIFPQKIILYQTDDYDYALEYPVEGFGNEFLDALDGSYCTYSAYGETGDDPVLDPTYPDPHPGGYQGKLMCGTYTPTHVISVSYGEAEIDLPEYYQKRQCNEFMKLGLQGHTFLYSSGDFGVGGYPGDATASGCLGPNATIFDPQFPVNCPYVTAVGATKVYPGHTVFEPESAANDLIGQPWRRAYSSAGGFSNVYDVPSYQAEAVASYFEHYNPPYKYYNGNSLFGANGGVYNRNGRGIPDVSANGDNIAVFLEGNFTINGGTSAATPIFASIITLINEERLAVGKSTVGFINPALYSNPWVLNDITNGSNPNCGTAGFSAVPGWDPVTGLGTPNYPRMLELFMSLP